MTGKKGLNSTQAILICAVIGAVLIIGVSGFFSIDNIKTTEPPKSSLDTALGGGGNYLWQSLYVQNIDGSSYWANAPKPFTLQQIFGSSSGQASDFKEIKSMQNNIYMKLNESVDSWSFSCRETVFLTDSGGSNGAGNVVSVIVPSTAVNANGNLVSANQPVWVTGASFSEANLQMILDQPPGTYYFVVTLSNINLQLTINGQTTNIGAVSGPYDNVLNWMIQIQ